MKLHRAITTYRSQEPVLNENIAVTKLNANIKSFNVSTRTNPGHSVPFHFVSRFIHSMVFHRTFVEIIFDETEIQRKDGGSCLLYARNR